MNKNDKKMLWETERILGEGYVLQVGAMVRITNERMEDGYEYGKYKTIAVPDDTDMENSVVKPKRIVHMSKIIANFDDFEDDIYKRLGKEMVESDNGKIKNTL